MRKGVQKGRTNLCTICTGTLLSVIFAIGISMVIALLIKNGALEESWIETSGMLAIGISIYVGIVLSHMLTGCRKIYTCASIAVAYLLCLLLLGRICFDDSICGFGSCFFVTFGCGFLAVVSMKTCKSKRAGYGYKARYRALKQ